MTNCRNWKRTSRGPALAGRPPAAARGRSEGDPTCSNQLPSETAYTSTRENFKNFTSIYPIVKCIRLNPLINLFANTHSIILQHFTKRPAGALRRNPFVFDLSKLVLR